MNEPGSHVDIVDTLAKHEEVIGRLYQAYAQRFPEHQPFWSQLADEERQHADMLHRLHRRMQAGEGTICEDAFNKTCIHDSLSRIEQLIQEALKPDLTLHDALSNASVIEKSMLEQRYFEVFAGNCPEIQHIQNFLAQATEDHRDRINTMLSAMT
jgi:hypothetical protein